MSAPSYDAVEVPGYADRHAACPKCRNSPLERTTMGILRGWNTNRTWCRCGWKGTVHDLVPVQTKEPK